MSESEPEVRSAIEGFAAAWRQVMTNPHRFFAEMPETGGLQEPTLFLAICAGLNALGHLLIGRGVAGMLWVGIGQMIGSYIAAALFVLIAQHLFEGRGGFEATFRVVAYASAPLVVLWLPLVGVLAWLYSAYLILRGLERVQRLDTTRAVLTLMIGVGVLWLLRAVRPLGAGWL